MKGGYKVEDETETSIGVSVADAMMIAEHSLNQQIEEESVASDETGSSDSSEGETEGEGEEDKKSRDGNDKHEGGGSTPPPDAASSSQDIATATEKPVPYDVMDDTEFINIFNAIQNDTAKMKDFMDVLKLDAEKSMAKFLYVKKFLAQQEKLMKKEQNKADKKAAREAQKKETKDLKEMPFNISVVMPDGDVKQLEVKQSMTVKDLRDAVANLMKATKKAGKLLRLESNNVFITENPRKTLGGFKNIGEGSRISASFGVKGGGKRTLTSSNRDNKLLLIQSKAFAMKESFNKSFDNPSFFTMAELEKCSKMFETMMKSDDNFIETLIPQMTPEMIEMFEAKIDYGEKRLQENTVASFAGFFLKEVKDLEQSVR